MHHYCTDDTIVATASAPGRGVRGVVRMSGPATLPTLAACFAAADGRSLRDISAACCISGSVQAADGLGPVPCELLLWPSNRSYTRQVAAELHLIGSAPILQAVQRALIDQGARLAEPGEFTLRAFLAGRIDLTQAEAVLGIVDAVNDADLCTALTQLAGGLRQPLQHVRAALLSLLADLEAGLDFADQEIEFIDHDTLGARLRELADEMDLVLNQMARRGHHAHHYRIVLRGWPNTGKSSLLNALSDGEVALVSAEHGTTRDYVRARVVWDGIPCELYDTAGHTAADTATPIEAEAQRLTDRLVGDTDLELFCLDATRPLNAWETAMLARTVPYARMIVLTKLDACGGSPAARPGAVATSSHTRQGIRSLRDAICRRLQAGPGRASIVAATLERGRQACTQASQSLGRAIAVTEIRGGDELVAAELRLALDCIGQVVGVVSTDELLGQIFGRFCVGK